MFVSKLFFDGMRVVAITTINDGSAVLAEAGDLGVVERVNVLTQMPLVKFDNTPEGIAVSFRKIAPAPN